MANYLRNEGSAEKLRAIAEKERLGIRLSRANLTNERGLELDRSLQDCVQTSLGWFIVLPPGSIARLDEFTDPAFRLRRLT